MFNKIKKMLKKEKNQKRIFVVAVIIVILLSLLLIISRNFGTFSNVSVRKNNKKIFTIEDLTVNNVKLHDTQKDIEKEFGKPKEEKTKTEGNYKYKVLYYDGIKFTLKENYSSFILNKVEITSGKYKINRNIKVGNRILGVIKKFKVSNNIGTYLYGNKTVDALDDPQIKEEIYVGVRSNEEVVYVYKDANVNSLPTNIARLNISYKHGKVSKIIWSYDYK